MTPTAGQTPAWTGIRSWWRRGRRAWSRVCKAVPVRHEHGHRPLLSAGLPTACWAAAAPLALKRTGLSGAEHVLRAVWPPQPQPQGALVPGGPPGPGRSLGSLSLPGPCPGSHQAAAFSLRTDLSGTGPVPAVTLSGAVCASCRRAGLHVDPLGHRSR